MKRILGVVGVLLVLACPLIAQLSTSSLLGTVRDSSGAVIPGAKITATNTGTNVTRTTESGSDGLYRIDGLQPGDYNVTIEKSGFSTEKLNAMTLTVAQNTEANVALKVGSQQETVQVEADTAPQINVTSSSLGGLVNDKQVSELPLNGRNFIDLALLQPGVANAQNNAPTLLKANYFSTNGAPIRSNLTSLDGAPMVNVLGSTSSAVGTTLGIDGIQEFRVISNNPPAQYGMGMGSQIVINSKGGTNQFHGDVYDYLRNNDMDAWGYFAASEPKLIRNNYGGAFGGPIQKDKTFFFATYEGISQIQGVTNNSNVFQNSCNPNATGSGGSALLQLTQSSNPCSTTPFTYNGINYNCPSGCATTSGAVNPAMAPFAALYPAANTNATTTAAAFVQNNNQPTSVNYGQIRVDHTFSASDSMFGRLTIDKSNLVAPVSYPGTLYQNVGSNSQGSDQFDSLVENHVFSPTLLNTARLSYSRTLNQNLPTNPLALAKVPYQMVYNQNVWAGSIATASGLAGFGPGGTQPQGFNQNVYTASDDLNWTKGKHAVQFGTIFNRVEYYLYDAQSIRGLINFLSPSTFLAGVSQVVAFQPPGSNYYREPRYYTFGFYGQDDWRFTSRLTLNLGLRYEPDTAPLDRLFSRDWAFHAETDPAPTHGAILRNTSLKNFQPRLGFAWDVKGDGKTSVRAGGGVYDDVNSMGQSFYGPSAGTPPTSIVGQMINQTITSFPIVTSAFALTPGTMPYGQGLKTTIWNISQPTMYQWNVSVQRQLTGSTSFTLAYAGSKGRHLWDNEEGNTCLPDSVNNGVPSWASPFAVAPANVGGSGNPAGQLLNPLYNPASTNFLNIGQPKYVSVVCTKVNNPGTASAAIATGAYPSDASYKTGTGVDYIVSTRLNPLWGDWLLATTNAGSNYNAAEFSFNKRVSHGLEATVAYTFSKVMDESQGQYSISECAGSGGNPSIAILKYRRKYNYGPACFDVPQQLQASALYHFPNVNKAGLIGKELLSGWWMGNKTTWQTGFAFSPTANNWRSLSQNISSNTGYQSEYVNYGTATVTPGSLGPDGTTNTTSSTFIPFDSSKVIVNSKATKGFVQWFNPLMFTDNTLGQLGTVHKAALRGPHYSSVDLSLNKDTALPGMGEKGALEFRAEVFNVLNHSNYAVPSGYKSFGGTVSTSALGLYQEAPLATAGRTTSTVGNPRQIQVSLKLLF